MTLFLSNAALFLQKFVWMVCRFVQIHASFDILSMQMTENTSD